MSLVSALVPRSIQPWPCRRLCLPSSYQNRNSIPSIAFSSAYPYVPYCTAVMQILIPSCKVCPLCCRPHLAIADLHFLLPVSRSWLLKTQRLPLPIMFPQNSTLDLGVYLAMNCSYMGRKMNFSSPRSRKRLHIPGESTGIKSWSPESPSSAPRQLLESE
jgi:hypothetical protein